MSCVASFGNGSAAITSRLGLHVAIAALAFGPTGANALELMPMRMTTPSGVLHITNKSNRSIRVSLNVYPARAIKGGKTSASLTPFPEQDAEALIRLRPSAFRLGPNTSRLVNYRLLASANVPEFFVCAERQAQEGEIANIRICSRWRPGS